MSAPHTAYPLAPSPRSSGPKIFAVVLATVVATGMVLTLTCAGACVGLFKFSEGLIEADVAAKLREPLRPYIGEVRSFDLNWSESAQHGEDVMVYDVEGSLGEGSVVVLHPFAEDGTMEVTWALLKPTDGEPCVLIGDPPERFLAKN